MGLCSGARECSGRLYKPHCIWSGVSSNRNCIMFHDDSNARFDGGGQEVNRSPPRDFRPIRYNHP